MIKVGWTCTALLLALGAARVLAGLGFATGLLAVDSPADVLGFLGGETPGQAIDQGFRMVLLGVGLGLLTTIAENTGRDRNGKP